MAVESIRWAKSIIIPPEPVRLQITSSSSGENSLCTCMGLPLSGAGRLLPRLAKVLATHTIGRVGQCFFEHAFFDEKLEVHLSFSPQAGDAFQKCLTIGFYR